MGALSLDSDQSNIFPGLQDCMKDAATFATYVAHNGRAACLVVFETSVVSFHSSS